MVMPKTLMGVHMSLGASSVAMMDKDYNVLRAKGKDLWSIRYYKECDSAADRRLYRAQRRMRTRKKARLALIRSYFLPMIMEVDPDFFRRLDSARLWADDKPEGLGKNILFDDEGYGDSAYYKDYPTIFHLRHDLLTSKEYHDPRMVYLAVSHLFKHRGNSYTKLSDSDSMSVEQAFKELFAILDSGEYGDTLQGLLFASDVDYSEVEKLCSDTSISKAERARQMGAIFKTDNRKAENAYLKAVCGNKVKLDALIPDLETDDKFDVDLSSASWEEKVEDIRSSIGDSYDTLLEAISNVYNACALFGILKDFSYICDAKIDDYEKHKKDLRILKNAITRIDGSKYGKLYRRLFCSAQGYAAYVKNEWQEETEDKRTKNSTDRQTLGFYDTIKKVLEENPGKVPKKNEAYILREIENGTFLPKQMVSENRVIPADLLARELSAILDNAETYLSELEDVDESGLTVSERIKQLFSFRLPYFVGPSSRGENSRGWRVERSRDKVLPWNLEETIDLDRTLEAFILNATGTCTYLPEERVMATSSPLYQRYCVLNELNSLKINDRKVSPEVKKALFNDLFTKGSYVSKAKIVSYLKKKELVKEDTDVTGIADKFTSALTTKKYFDGIFGEGATEKYADEIEKIVFLSTVYGTEKSFFKKRLEKEYGTGSADGLQLSDEQIKKILAFNPGKWGNLSEKLLTMKGDDRSERRKTSIMEVLWNDSVNLEEILNTSVYSFGDDVLGYQKQTVKSLDEMTIDDLDDYLSASQTRTVWQTFRVIKDMIEVAGYTPEKIYVSTQRDPITNKPIKKDARYRELKAILSKLSDKQERKHWLDVLEDFEKKKMLRQKKVYLYIRQLGKDLFTAKDIDLEEALKGDEVYNIEHILPKHYSSDDNIELNLALINTQQNTQKSDTYPLDASIRSNEAVRALWLKLLRAQLMNAEKYHRLTSPSPLTDEQKAAYITARITDSCVESKALIALLRQALPDVEIYYSKYKNINEFRNRFDLLRCDVVNKFAVAQDGYLAGVVGNIWQTKFGRSPLFYIMQNRNKSTAPYHYNLSRMYDFDVVRYTYESDGEHDGAGKNYSWIAPTGTLEGNGKKVTGGSIDTVRKMLNKNSAVISFMNAENTGGLSDATVRPASVASPGVYRPLKAGEDVARYGGMTSIKGAYFILVEHTQKGKRVKTVEAVSILGKVAFEKDPEKYCREVLGLEDAVIKAKINPGSLIKLNGFRQLITGRSGNQLIYQNATQLKLDPDTTEYIRRVSKSTGEYIDRSVTVEKNLEAYDKIRDTIAGSPFARVLTELPVILASGRKAFERLELEKQIYVLLQILSITQVGASNADLTLIGSKTQGRIITSKNYTRVTEAKLIHQSPSGLIANEIDLLKI